jgi:hypothetical protein
MLPGIFVTQRMPTRRGLSSSGPVMNSTSGDLLRQPGELALCPATHIELPPTDRRRTPGRASVLAEEPWRGLWAADLADTGISGKHRTTGPAYGARTLVPDLVSALQQFPREHDLVTQ